MLAEEAVSYPFLPGSWKILASGEGLDMRSLIRDCGGNPGIWLDAVRRIRDHEDGRIPAEGRVPVVIGGRPYPAGLVTFVCAVMLCAAKSARILTRRFALAEAVAVEKRLRRGLADCDPSAAGLIRQISDMDVSACDGGYAVPVASYLKHSVALGAKEWKLVNRRVSGGLVYLTVHETARLIRHRTAARIQSLVEGVGLTAEEAAGLEPYTSRIGLTCEAPPPAHVPSGREEYPPCMRNAIRLLEDGDNLPHSSRFMLASYLVKIGRPDGEIIDLFRPAPDFNEGTTGYHVGNIRKAGYVTPGCDKIASLGACLRDKSCGSIRHPLSYRPGGGRQ